jgi:hypothetical protein
MAFGVEHEICDDGKPKARRRQEVQGQGFDDVKRAQVDKVVSILEDWARWQQAYSVFLGAPRRSLGFDLGGSAVTAESGEQNREVARPGAVQDR